MNNTDAVGFLVAVFVVIVGIAALIGWHYDSDWFYKSLYILKDSVNWSQVNIEKKPHDCEYDTAPLGNKNCHYEPRVTKVEWSTDQQNYSIKSVDSGQTWFRLTPGKCLQDETQACPSPYDPSDNIAPEFPTVTGVIIEWDKIQD